VLTGLGRYDEAFAACHEALRLTPKSYNLAANLALMALDAGKEWQACKVIMELVGQIDVV
jgi:hypothetical protein